MAEHTPGPWERTCTAFGLLGVASVETWERIVMLTPHKDDPKYGESYANANLIAAAPDLLYALESLMVEINPPTPGSIGETRINMVYSAAKAAVAKARGGT